MARDPADRDMLRRGKHGALTMRQAATGSSMRGGSVTHIGGRKRLLRALHAGKGVLVRASDGVCLRAATFDEIVEWAASGPEGVRRIHVNDVIGEDGSFGVVCDIRHYPLGTQTTAKLDTRPRLVPRDTQNITSYTTSQEHQLWHHNPALKGGAN